MVARHMSAMRRWGRERVTIIFPLWALYQQGAIQGSGSYLLSHRFLQEDGKMPIQPWNGFGLPERALLLVLLWGVAACGTPVVGQEKEVHTGVVALVDADTEQAQDTSLGADSDADTKQGQDTSLGVDSDADVYVPPPSAWPKIFGGSDSDYVRAMARGSDGRFIVAGEMRDQWDFAGETLETAVIGGKTALIMSFEPDGTPLWGRVLGGLGHTHAHGVAVSPTGEIAACGTKQSPLTHGDIVQSEGSHGVFAAAWEPDGTASWLHTFEGGLLGDMCDAIVIEQNSESPFVGHTLMAFVNEEQLHLARINPSGELVYRVAHGNGLNLPSTNVSPIQAMASDGKGAVWVTGMFVGGTARSLGGDDFTPPGSSAIFLAKYDIETGDHLWSMAWGSPAYYGIAGHDSAAALQVIAGRVVIAVNSLPQIDFGDGPLGPEPDGNIKSGFLAAFDLFGAHVWSYELRDEDGSKSIAPRDLDATKEGELAVFASGRLLRIDPAGGVVSARATIDPGGDYFLIDSSGMATISYMLYKTGLFGGVELTSAGKADIVLNRVPMP
jgi:hypothetical protein